MANQRALIVGLAGATLNNQERTFLARVKPCGLILFSRNCQTHDQIKALVAAAIDAIADSDTLVLIDQEGGRVQRLRPPLARSLPPAANYAALYASDPARACEIAFDAARLVAQELRNLGINTNCAPVLDVPVPGSHDIIGDRAYGATVAQITALGGAVARGLMAGGVLPVMKHIPGHGRAEADSHHDLPVVTASHAALSGSDFAAFAALAHLPAAMTAHVVYETLDADRPATLSRRLIADVIRREIGFDGLLMSDDLSMNALTGPLAERARETIAAGCDVILHCNGVMSEMEAISGQAPILSGVARRRFEQAVSVTRTINAFDEGKAAASLEIALDVGSPRPVS